MTATAPELSTTVDRLYAQVYRDGIAGVPGALPRAWGKQMRRDFEGLFEDARSRPDGTVNRGTNRFYFTVHPERLAGFVDLVTHPVIRSLSEKVLGPDWEVVEVAFDVPLPASRYQPWHRDFPPSRAEREQRRFASLAFNFTAVDVTPDMGPFEIAPGTQWDDGSAFDHGMFPRGDAVARYDELGQQRMPRLGDMSVRSGLTVHRGSPNRSDTARPVLILGVVGPDADPGPHGLQLSTTYAASLPPEALPHLRYEVVDELRPLAQTHDIEGLVMGD